MTSKVYFTSNTARQTEKTINDNFDDIESRTEALEAKTHTSDFTNDGSGTEFEVVAGYTAFTTTSDYVGYYVLVSTTYTKVTSSNKDSLSITAGTTKAYQFSPYATREYVDENGGKIDSISVNNTPQTIDANKNVNITVPTQASDVNALPSSTKYGASIDLSMNSTTYVLTIQLKDQDGNNLGQAKTVDLPLESIVSDAQYYATYTYEGTTYTKVIVITLATTSVPTIVPVGDLVSGLQNELTAGSHITINNDVISGEEGITTIEDNLFVVYDKNTGIYRWKTTSGTATFTYGSTSLTFTAPFEAMVIISADTRNQWILAGVERNKIYIGVAGGTQIPGTYNVYDTTAILQTGDIIDNLTTQSAAAPLSAKQGYQLNQNKQDKYSTLSFTASDAGWSSADSDGFYTLTITSAKKPLICFDTNGEQIMAGLKSDGTNIYVIADAKFAGSVLAF